MTPLPNPACPGPMDLDPIEAWGRHAPTPMLLLGGGAPRVLYANPAFAACIGQGAEGMRGRLLRDVLPHLALSGHLRLLDRIRRRGRPYRRAAVALRLRPSAPTRLWSVEATPLADAADPPRLLLLLRDVTAERQALREGEAARATLDALFAHIPEGLILAEGREGRIRRVSAHGLALSGRPAEAVLGRASAEHPADWEVLRADGRTPARAEELPLTRAARRGETVQHETWVVRRATDGVLVPILCSAGPIRDDHGRVTGAILAWRDVTDLHRARAALAASEARYRALAETMPHLVWQTDAAGRPQYMNRRLQDFTGLTPASATPERLRRTIHPDDTPGLAAAWRAAQAEGAELDTDARLAAPEGGWRWFRIQGAPVRDASGAVRQWVGTCTDVEDRRRAEAALRQAAEAHEGLARIADHRIKNSLQLVASLLRLKAGRMTDPAVRDALGAAVGRVQAVAEAHRALSRSPDLRNVRLADILEELAAGATRQHPGADLRTEVPAALMLDAERAIPLALVLNELVARVLHRDRPGDGGQAAGDGPGDGGNDGAGRGTVWLYARVVATAAELEVTVHGRGLERGLRPGAPDGVGETIIHALIRQIGACLSVEVAPDPAGRAGEGTRMVLRLPLVDPEAPP